ncbi:MAG: hypothetical protein AB1601_00305 [Planctomycetota bacterium]
MRLLTVLLVCAGATTALASSVQATIVADGNYALYTGSADGTEIDYIGEGTGAADAAAAARKFYFEIEDQRYVYLAVWATPATARGLLAQFLFNDLPVFSGDPAWEVYCVAADPLPGGASPSTSILSAQVRRANRRFAWLKPALNGVNTVGSRRLVEAIGEKAAWMNLPADALTVASEPGGGEPGAVWLIFRLSPNEIWPEIELWHSHNVGRAPLEGGDYNANGRYHYLGGGGGSGGGDSSPLWPRGRGDVTRVPNPFPNTAPPNSNSVPPTVPPSEPSNPVIPPPVPEPTAALLMFVGAAWLRRR